MERTDCIYVYKSPLLDTNLSTKAKGLYCIIAALLEENDTLTKDIVKANVKEGDKAFNTAWKELRECGYLSRERINIPGIKARYRYKILDGRGCNNEHK